MTHYSLYSLAAIFVPSISLLRSEQRVYLTFKILICTVLRMQYLDLVVSTWLALFRRLCVVVSEWGGYVAG